MLRYKGYIGHVQYDDEAEIFHGEVINLKDVITFQSDNAHQLKQVFIDSVDDYLDYCAELGEEPEKPFSGKLNLRLTPRLHCAAFIAAKKSGKSLNSWMCDALEQATKQSLH